MLINDKALIQKDLHQIHTKWKSRMHFECCVNDHNIHVDKLEQHGGEDKGPRPKQLILAAISGCTGMEIMSILEKMRLQIEGLDIDVSAELSNEIPKVYKTIHIVFTVKCLEPYKDRIKKAIDLGVDKYCGVVAMVKKFAVVTTEIRFC